MITDYKSGLLQISASLHHYFSLDSEYDGDPVIDAWLNDHHFRCVIAVLVDAMGTSILRKHLTEDDFLYAHNAQNVMSVFPPTTSAATTSFLTGKSPAENGWLGWSQYFHELNDQIILFFGRSKYGCGEYPDYAYKHLPVKMIYEKMNEIGMHAESVWPDFKGKQNTCRSFHEECVKTLELAQKEDVRFIYMYYDGLDSLMHKQGTNTDDVHHLLLDIQNEIECLCENIPDDCGVLVIADHSMKDIQPYDLRQEKELLRMLKRYPAIEPRTTAFYVKDEYLETFPKYFLEKFGESFDLYTHKEVVEKKLFGPGAPHPRFEEFIGDYLAVAKGNYSLLLEPKDVHGDHAGGCEEEVMIPMILYPFPQK